MKKIRCPKCDEPILFDDSLYTPARTLVFECPSCRKQFKIRVGGKALTSQYSGSFGTDPEQEEKPAVGYLVVLENAFHLRQIVPLREGENRIGRHVKGTKAEAALKVSHTKAGRLLFVLRDGPSGTGTFHMNELVGVKERVNLSEGAIVTIGATTMILHEGTPPEEE